MSTEPKSSPLLRIRTFAHDLEITRVSKDHPVAPPKKVHVDDVREKVTSSSIKPLNSPKKNVTATLRAPRLKQPDSSPKKSSDARPKITPISTPAADKKPVAQTLPKTALQDSLSQFTEKPKTVPGSGLKKVVAGPKEIRDTAYEATIITDAKHNRFQLGSELINSLKTWWLNKKKNHAAGKKPKYTVPRAERRKGVIQRATSTTARASTADHSAVIKRIKDSNSSDRLTMPVAPVIVPIEIPAAVNTYVLVPEPTPEPITIPQIVYPTITPVVGYNALTTPEPTITPIIPTLPEPAVEHYEEEELPFLPEDTDDDWVNQDENVSEPEPEIEPAPLAPPVVITPIVYGRIEPMVPGGIPILPPQAQPSVTQYQQSLTPSIFQRLYRTITYPSFSIRRRLIENPNQLALTVLSIVTFVFIGYVGIQTFIGTSTTAPENDFREAVLFTGATRYQDVFIATNKQTMFDQIGSYRDDSTALFEVIFTGPNTDKQIPATTILGILATALPADFVASIDSVVFGYYRGEPWFVLKTGNKNTAYGGMLQWESNLSRDLEPWFGGVVRTTGSGSGFRDGAIGATDVRVLLSTDGRERITYGFIGQNNVLITTNTTSFLNLKTSLSE